jgi:hypothetical protein
MSFPDRMKDLLNYRPFTDEVTLLDSQNLGRYVAREMYGVDSDDILIDEPFASGNSNVAGHKLMLKDGTSKTYYVKEEEDCYVTGAFQEAVGITLNNLLTGEDRNFLMLVNKLDLLDNFINVVIMDEVPGTTFNVNYDFLTEISYSMGRAFESAKILNLADRRSPNMLIDDNLVIRNIDFGALFWAGWDDRTGKQLVKNSGYSEEEFEKGRLDAREEMRVNFKTNEELIRDLANWAYDGLLRSELFETISPFDYIKQKLEGEIN